MKFILFDDTFVGKDKKLIPANDSSKIEFHQDLIVESDSLIEIASSMCEFHCCPSIFNADPLGNCRKTLANFKSSDWIALDFDDGTDLEAMQCIEHAHFILASKNHMLPKNGVTKPRFHVFVPLAVPILDVQDYKRAIDYFGAENLFFSTRPYEGHKHHNRPVFDSACREASRYYFRHREVLSINSVLPRYNPTHGINTKRTQEAVIARSKQRLASMYEDSADMTTERFMEVFAVRPWFQNLNTKGNQHEAVRAFLATAKSMKFEKEAAWGMLCSVKSMNAESSAHHRKTLDWIY